MLNAHLWELKPRNKLKFFLFTSILVILEISYLRGLDMEEIMILKWVFLILK